MAPSFTFRFATLLKLREAARDARQAELNEALQAEEAVREHIDEAAREIVALRDYTRQVSAGQRLNVDQLIASQRYELVLRAQQRHWEQQLEKVRAEIERRQQALVEASREVRVMEKLRERLRERFQQEEDRRLMMEIDEIAQRRVSAEVEA
jgi:flagellar protein FliJ